MKFAQNSAVTDSNVPTVMISKPPPPHQQCPWIQFRWNFIVTTEMDIFCLSSANLKMVVLIKFSFKTHFLHPIHIHP